MTFFVVVSFLGSGQLCGFGQVDAHFVGFESRRRRQSASYLALLKISALERIFSIDLRNLVMQRTRHFVLYLSLNVGG